MWGKLNNHKLVCNVGDLYIKNFQHYKQVNGYYQLEEYCDIYKNGTMWYLIKDVIPFNPV